MSKLPPTEYVQLKGFLQAFTERFFPSNLALELRPVALLEALESEVRRRYSSAYASLRKHGRIRNEVEYYLARGILADQSLNLEAEEWSELSLLVASYEKQATNR